MDSKKSALIFFILVLLLPSYAISGVFKVSPIRLVFDKKGKSGIITVLNEGDEKLQLQMTPLEWIQDAEGKDQYVETKDIIFFPRIMILQKGEEKIIRVGTKSLPREREKTYRFFIEEIPEPKPLEGTELRVAIKFGVPVMAKPSKEEPKGEINKLELSGSKLNVIIKNNGNVHFIINAIKAKGLNKSGEEIFSKEVAGWYLLHGISRSFIIEIPPDVCKNAAKIDLDVITDRFTMNGKVDVDKAMCAP